MEKEKKKMDKEHHKVMDWDVVDNIYLFNFINIFDFKFYFIIIIFK